MLTNFICFILGAFCGFIITCLAVAGGKELNNMKFSNRTYDLLKELTTVWLPALGTLYFALSGIWGFPYGEQIVGTITAVVTFLGVCLHLSTNNYRSDKIQDTFNTDDIDMIEVEHEDTDNTAEE